MPLGGGQAFPQEFALARWEVLGIEFGFQGAIGVVVGGLGVLLLRGRNPADPGQEHRIVSAGAVGDGRAVGQLSPLRNAADGVVLGIAVLAVGGLFGVL